MVAASGLLTRRFSYEARVVYNKLDIELRNEPHRIPELTELPIVIDPENVLSYGERREITTGIEDERMRASFDLMSLPLKYAIRTGFDLGFRSEEESRDYRLTQMSWMARCKELLRDRLGKEPSPEEFNRDYFTDGAIFFKVMHLFQRPEMSMKVKRPLFIPKSDMGVFNLLVSLQTPSIQSDDLYAAA